MRRTALAFVFFLIGPVAQASVFERSAPKPVAFTLEDRDGGSHASAETRAPLTLVHFWASWCAPCREELPALEALQRDLSSAGVRVMAVSIDRLAWDAIERTEEKLDVHGLAMFLDRDRRAVAALAIASVPTTIALDSEGREIGRANGPRDWRSADARREIAAMIGAPQN